MATYSVDEVKEFFEAYVRHDPAVPKREIFPNREIDAISIGQFLTPEKLLELIELYKLDQINSMGEVDVVYAVAEIDSYDLETHTANNEFGDAAITLFLFTTRHLIRISIRPDPQKDPMSFPQTAVVQYHFLPYKVNRDELASYNVLPQEELEKLPKDLVLTLYDYDFGILFWTCKDKVYTLSLTFYQRTADFDFEVNVF